MTRLSTIAVGTRTFRHIDLRGILGDRLERLPFVLRLLAENHIRATGDTNAVVAALTTWLDGRKPDFEFTFRPNRLLMHDTTCTPALADIAGLRDAVAEAGLDPRILTPTLPVEVSVDHSLAVDRFARGDASTLNAASEIDRNRERYAFLKWASANLDGVHVNPPGTGIMHTINLEQLATILHIGQDDLVHPDMLLGTDSHTPMINGIGVLGWGIGGLEAESQFFGQASTLAMPEVVGVRLTGSLPDGVMVTDLALELTHELRDLGVTGSFVEFFGSGVSTLTADARAVIANMAPEYGASTGYFPVDDDSVAYLERTGRPNDLTHAIKPVMQSMGLWFDPAAAPHFDRIIELDLSSMAPTIAGPRRPQDRCTTAQAQTRVEAAIGRPLNDTVDGIPDGAIGIAAITSCTNTSDPRLLIAAGVLAQKARALGLFTPTWVKTSLAPGSPSARAYLERSGLAQPLSELGFDIVGFGCTTCIGNSGPLPDVIEDALGQGKAICAVLSGNRNFPGRVHPKLDLGYLASPPMVVAYAIKGTIAGDIAATPLATINGRNVMLADIWPTEAEIDAALTNGYRADDIATEFDLASHNQAWADIPCPDTPQFPWDPKSRNLRRPKFAEAGQKSRLGAFSAAPLMVLGDDMTTDHISPAGWIDPQSAAGQWLIKRGGNPQNLNVYASYRGNWEVMLRGLFTNQLAKNYLAGDLPPAHTCIGGTDPISIVEAAQTYAQSDQPVVLLAGERYGMGSSRDWAAKGVALLGVRAVIARSFERIHRTNLIGMGILPLIIQDDFVPHTAGIAPNDRFDITVEADQLTVGQHIPVGWRKSKGASETVNCRAAVETEQEVTLLQEGGILMSILNRTIEA